MAVEDGWMDGAPRTRTTWKEAGEGGPSRALSTAAVGGSLGLLDSWDRGGRLASRPVVSLCPPHALPHTHTRLFTAPLSARVRPRPYYQASLPVSPDAGS